MTSFLLALGLPVKSICQTIHLPSRQTNSLCLPWQTDEKLLKYTFSKSQTCNLAHLKEL